MADNINKFSINTPGNYYVGKDCIGCTLCSEIAPENIKPDSDESLEFSHSYVFSQPVSDTEIRALEEAIISCPADAIGQTGSFRDHE